MIEKIIPYEESFASHSKAIYWSNKNILKPKNVTLFSNRSFLFNCKECNHEIIKKISDISKNNGWCMYCKGYRCNNNKCDYCFNKSFASHPKSICWSEENLLKPRDVSKVDNNKYFFNCDKCSHKFEKSTASINKGEWCPYCCNNSKTLCGDEKCLQCFNKSFASSDNSIYWSTNNKISSINVFRFCDDKFLFYCFNCKKDYLSSPYSISNNRLCYCCNLNSNKLCDDQNCTLCFFKSFKSHEKSIYWSTKNKISPSQIKKNSNSKFWFNCDKCPHDFEISLNNLCGGKWCSYCSSSKLCNNNDCIYCENKSLSSYIDAFMWSDKNELNPREVFKGSDNKYIFDCKNCGNEFKMTVSHFTQGKRCNICKNKTEKKVYNELTKIYPEIIFQFKDNWTKNLNTNKFLTFDFCLKNQKILIEIDGDQHFKDILGWKSSWKINHENDIFKQQIANKEKFSVIRIYQMDIYLNKYNWINKIVCSINKIINDDKIQNIYLSSGNHYNIFDNYTIPI